MADMHHVAARIVPGADIGDTSAGEPRLDGREPLDSRRPGIADAPLRLRTVPSSLVVIIHRPAGRVRNLAQDRSHGTRSRG
jgi:hypothetical protein